MVGIQIISMKILTANENEVDNPRFLFKKGPRTTQKTKPLFI